MPQSKVNVSNMRVFLVVLLLVPAIAFSDQRIEKFIEVIDVESNLAETLEQLKLNSLSSHVLDTTPEFKQMSIRHNQDQLELYEKYFDARELKSKMAYAIKEVYSEKELDELYRFISTDVGASIFKKFDNVGEEFGRAFAELYLAYSEDSVELLQRQSEESNLLIAQLEQNMAKYRVEEHDQEGEQGSKIAEIVRFMIATENGKMIGYKIREGRTPGLFEKTPFKEGDIVISINGIQVNEPQKVKAVYEMLKTFDQIHFEVLKDDQITDFVIVISEILSS